MPRTTPSKCSLSVVARRLKGSSRQRRAQPIQRLTPSATLSDWLVAGSGVVLSEGAVLSESGQTGVASASDASLLGEP